MPPLPGSPSQGKRPSSSKSVKFAPTDPNKPKEIKEDPKKSISLSSVIQRRLQENETRLLIINYTVEEAEQYAIQEFRVAHPCKYLCDQCNQCFSTNKQYQEHYRDRAFHRFYVQSQLNKQEYYELLQNFYEHHSKRRQIFSNRLIFSPELETLSHRLQFVVHEPYRPHLIDPTNKRQKQLLKGMFVHGFDPSRGIRPAYRQSGLTNQHQANLRTQQHSQLEAVLKTLPIAFNISLTRKPTLKETLMILARCQDNFIDTISTCNHPKYKQLASYNHENMMGYVRFEWNDFALKEVHIKGEFSNWEPIEMPCDVNTGRFYHIQELTPGYHKYRFIVDGIEKVDSIASQEDDPFSPIGKCNIILITKAKLIDLNNTTTDDDLSDVSSVIQSKQKKLIKASLNNSTSRLSLDDESKSSHMEVAPGSVVPIGRIPHLSQQDKALFINRITKIDLRNQSLLDDGAWALASNIHMNSFIEEIDLSCNNISDEGMQSFAGTLKRLLGLKILRLNGNGFGLDSCRYIVQGLEGHPMIQTLELSSNRLGDDSLEILSKYVMYNTTLQALYLDHCYIGDDGLICLAEAIQRNRVLRILSLNNNNFTCIGIRELMKYIERNRRLTHLYLNDNIKLDSEGGAAIGNMLYGNQSLQYLSINHIKLLGNTKNNAAGIFAFAYGLRYNIALKSLSIEFNELNDYYMAELMDGLIYNENIIELKLQGNRFSDDWYVRYKTISSHKRNEGVPSIPDYLVRNKEKSIQMGKYSIVDVDIEEEIEGKGNVAIKGEWNCRKEWVPIPQNKEEKIKLKKIKLSMEQYQEQEDTWINDQIKESLTWIENYFEEPACKRYLQLISSSIIQYFHQYPKLPSDLLSLSSSAAMFTSSFSSKNVRLQSVKLLNNTSSTTFLSPPSSPLQATSQAFFSTKLSPLSMSLSIKPRGKSKRIEPKQTFPWETFVPVHTTILTAMFSIMSGHILSLNLQPERLQLFMQRIALPMLPDDVQPMVNETIIDKTHQLALHKVLDYLISNGYQLSHHNKWSRRKLLTDFYFHPPIEESQRILLQFFQFKLNDELRQEYRRKLVETITLQYCPYCTASFFTEEQLNMHLNSSSKRILAAHQRQRLWKQVNESQQIFLQQLKYQMTGVFFPAYYEIVVNTTETSSTSIENGYLPQVFDRMGNNGRPIAVVEPFRTVRAIDVLGDYLQVLLLGVQGWIRFQDSKLHRKYLQPIEGFDWNTLHLQDGKTYYRINDNLPDDIELKVRHQPKFAAKVLGQIRKNEIIECIAVIENWLQIRYHEEDAAWVYFKPDPKVSNELTHAPAPGKPSSPALRQRRVEKDTPKNMVEGHEDAFFDDSIVSYEINHKRYKSNTKKNINITKRKISFFDKLRYGDLDKQTSHDYLLLLPTLLQKKLIVESQNSSHKQSPFLLTQQELFDCVMYQCTEEEIDALEWNDFSRFDENNVIHTFDEEIEDTVYYHQD